MDQLTFHVPNVAALETLRRFISEEARAIDLPESAIGMFGAEWRGRTLDVTVPVEADDVKLVTLKLRAQARLDEAGLLP